MASLFTWSGRRSRAGLRAVDADAELGGWGRVSRAQQPAFSRAAHRELQDDLARSGALASGGGGRTGAAQEDCAGPQAALSAKSQL